jgi:hypothetical protein
MGDTKSPSEPVLCRVAHDLRLGEDSQTDETLLLLSMLDLALTNMDVAATGRDKEGATRCSMSAVDTYGSVKSLLPKLDLEPRYVPPFMTGWRSCVSGSGLAR